MTHSCCKALQGSFYLHFCPLGKNSLSYSGSFFSPNFPKVQTFEFHLTLSAIILHNLIRKSLSFFARKCIVHYSWTWIRCNRMYSCVGNKNLERLLLFLLPLPLRFCILDARPSKQQTGPLNLENCILDTHSLGCIVFFGVACRNVGQHSFPPLQR